MESKNIIIADDHKIVHDGIQVLLRAHPEFNISHTFFNGKEVLAHLANHQPDILISDISMPEMDGIELTQKVKNLYPNIKILILSVHQDEDTVRRILQSEADGFILKNTGTKQLVQALSSLVNGDTFYAQEIVSLLVKDLNQTKSTTAKKESLSPRELEILQLVVDELTTAQIAKNLFISPKTVDTHRKNILKKTGVKSIIGLIKYAIQNDLVQLNDR